MSTDAVQRARSIDGVTQEDLIRGRNKNRLVVTPVSSEDSSVVSLTPSPVGKSRIEDQLFAAPVGPQRRWTRPYAAIGQHFDGCVARDPLEHDMARRLRCREGLSGDRRSGFSVGFADPSRTRRHDDSPTLRAGGAPGTESRRVIRVRQQSVAESRGLRPRIGRRRGPLLRA